MTGQDKPGINKIFNTAVRQGVVMNLKTTCILLLLVAGLLALAGCTATTGPTPQAAVMTPGPVTPIKTTVPVTPLPAGEVARIRVDRFGMDPSTETVYEFVGSLHVSGGPYQSVEITVRYPDTQEYSYDLGGMGGANATLKPFSLFPADRYKGTNPEKIISLDGRRYGTIYRYEDGVIFWVASPENEIRP
jgi:hypothetical protein